MPLKFIILSGVVMQFICFTTCAQRSRNVQDHILIKESDKYLYGAQEANYEGSPYLNENFVKGYVYSGNEKFNGVPMRYNIFQDKIEFQDLGVMYLLEPDTLINKVEIGNQILVVESFKFLSKTQPAFLELLESGKLTLMAKKTVNYRERILISDIPAKYVRSADVFYYKYKNEDMLKVGSIKNLVASLPDKQQEINRFVKEQKTSSKDKDGLIKFVKYYNSISD